MFAYMTDRTHKTVHQTCLAFAFGVYKTYYCVTYSNEVAHTSESYALRSEHILSCT